MVLRITGSITPQPQPGNDKPRLFRLSEDSAVINRYGFNSQGAQVVENRLRNYFENVSNNKNNNSNSNKINFENKPLILGINLGKNKTSPSAIDDYTYGISKLGPFANYLVINVSSPNTPGLRNLQAKQQLYDLLNACKVERDKLIKNNNINNNNNKSIPLLVKIAPDLSEDDINDIADVSLKVPIDGLIIGNTTIKRPNTLKSKHKNEIGGLSGLPLYDKSTALVSEFYTKTNGKIPIIGVGGISNAQQAYDKIRAGASLIQIYSMYSYFGPVLINKIKGELSELVKKDGYNSIQQAVGTKLYKKQIPDSEYYDPNLIK